MEFSHSSLLNAICDCCMTRHLLTPYLSGGIGYLLRVLQARQKAPSIIFVLAHNTTVKKNMTCTVYFRHNTADHVFGTYCKDPVLGSVQVFSLHSPARCRKFGVRDLPESPPAGRLSSHSVLTRPPVHDRGTWYLDCALNVVFLTSSFPLVPPAIASGPPSHVPLLSTHLLTAQRPGLQWTCCPLDAPTSLPVRWLFLHAW